MDNLEKVILKIQELIDNKDISASKIAKDTGIGATTVKYLRLGTRNLDTMKLDNLKKLYYYQLNLEQEKDDK